jgi:hypothetical protein
VKKSDPSWERAMKNWRTTERRSQRESEREQGKTEKPAPSVGIEKKREGRG